jgi:hypothetical protein
MPRVRPLVSVFLDGRTDFTWFAADQMPKGSSGCGSLSRRLQAARLARTYVHLRRSKRADAANQAVCAAMMLGLTSGSS